MTTEPITDELLSLTLQISADGQNWYPVSFTGENAKFIDFRAAAYISEHRDLFAAIDESSNYAQFPATFNAAYLGLYQIIHATS
jgi:hypothetical protein